MKNRGETRKRFMRAPGEPVHLPEMSMSPGAGSCGFAETRRAAAACSEAYFDDSDQLAVQKRFVKGVLHPLKW